MRLWHQDLIEKLPRAQLLGQHRECAALRGGGWGKPHATVNYVFAHSPYLLFLYHELVMREMLWRGYRPDGRWFDPLYRGKTEAAYAELAPVPPQTPLYPEHDDAYMAECLDNLRGKNIILE